MTPSPPEARLERIDQMTHDEARYALLAAENRIEQLEVLALAVLAATDALDDPIENLREAVA